MKNAFLDTNVLLYFVDPTDPQKHLKALSLLENVSQRFTISVQVLQEFYWSATRKLRIPPSQAKAFVGLWSQQRVHQPGPDLVLQAIDTSERYQISFWDALIVEAAVQSGCDTLLTEDLSHGQVIRGVSVQNPFVGI